MRYVLVLGILTLLVGCAAPEVPDAPPPPLISPRVMEFLDWSGCMVRDRATGQLFVELRDKTGEGYLWSVLDDGTLQYAPGLQTDDSSSFERRPVPEIQQRRKLNITW